MSTSVTKKEFEVLAAPNHSANFIFTFNDFKTKALYAIDQEEGVLIYNYHTNKWSNYGNFISVDGVHNQWLPNSWFSDDTTLAAIDSGNNTIFFINYSKKIAILRMKMCTHEASMTMKWEINDAVKIGPGAESCVIGDKYHIIGGWKTNKHVLYTPTTDKFDTIHDFDKMKGDFQISYHHLVQFRNKLLLFGGLDTSNKPLGTIYEYSFQNNAWNKLDIKCPPGLSSFGATTVLREQFVILFGGEKENEIATDEIWIYCVQNQSFRKSKVKCPINGEWQQQHIRAYSYNDDKRDELTVFGYIRESFQNMTDDGRFPPRSLIKIIYTYFLNEWIHLFFFGWDSLHWRIDVCDILA